MKHLLTSIFILLSSCSFSQCLKADIIFLLDWSGSEDSNRVFIPIAAHDFLQNLKLGPSAVRMGIIPFNENPISPYCLRPSYDESTISSALFSLMNTTPHGGTSFPTSFELADDYFSDSEADRGEPVLRVIVMFSDGQEGMYTKSRTLWLADEMREIGTIIWCISTPDVETETYTVMGKSHLKAICGSPEFFREEYYADVREMLLQLCLCP